MRGRDVAGGNFYNGDKWVFLQYSLGDKIEASRQVDGNQNPLWEEGTIVSVNTQGTYYVKYTDGEVWWYNGTENRIRDLDDPDYYSPVLPISKKTPRLELGELVQSRYGGEWYQGTIVKKNENGTYNVLHAGGRDLDRGNKKSEIRHFKTVRGMTYNSDLGYWGIIRPDGQPYYGRPSENVNLPELDPEIANLILGADDHSIDGMGKLGEVDPDVEAVDATDEAPVTAAQLSEMELTIETLTDKATNAEEALAQVAFSEAGKKLIGETFKESIVLRADGGGLLDIESMTAQDQNGGGDELSDFLDRLIQDLLNYDPSNLGDEILPKNMKDLDMKTMAGGKCVSDDCAQQFADWEFFQEILEANIDSESIDDMDMFDIWGRMAANKEDDFGEDTLRTIQKTLNDKLKNVMEVVNGPTEDNEDNDDVDVAETAENCCCC